MRSNDSLAAASPPPVVALAEHRDLVLQICRRWLGNVQDAEDATQETLVRALTSWHRLDPGRPLLPWLRQIAVNRCRTRRSERARNVVRQHPGPDSIVCPADWAAQNRVRLERRELLCRIDEVLGTLPPDWVDAFLAVQRSGQTHQQVADRLGRPVGTIKTWVHRTRMRLIDQIADPSEAR